MKRTRGYTQQKEVQMFNNDQIWGAHARYTGGELVIKPDPEKLERLRAFPKPQNPADVQSLIGIIKTFDRWNLGLSAKCEKIRE